MATFNQNINSFLYTHPIFLRNELVAFKRLKGTTKQDSINHAIQYYIKKGRIVLIRRGLYAFVPPNSTPENHNIDPYLIAGKMADDNVLAYHTALELHGVAYSVFNTITFLTKHKIKPFNYAGNYFQPVAISKAIKKNHSEKSNVTNIKRQGIDIRVTNLERTFVDVLNRTDLSGGWEEVSRSIEKIVVLDVDMVIAYCLSLKNSKTVAKVGFFLEQRQGVFATGKKQLAKLEAKKPKWPQYEGKAQKGKYKFVPRWNLMLPENLINKTWEEPNDDF